MKIGTGSTTGIVRGLSKIFNYKSNNGFCHLLGNSSNTTTYRFRLFSRHHRSCVTKYETHLCRVAGNDCTAIY